MKFLFLLCACFENLLAWPAVYFLRTLQRFSAKDDKIGIYRTFLIAGVVLWYGILILIFIILDLLYDLAAIF